MEIDDISSSTNDDELWNIWIAAYSYGSCPVGPAPSVYYNGKKWVKKTAVSKKNAPSPECVDEARGAHQGELAFRPNL